MIRESFLIRESLLNKKLCIFDSRINLEQSHFKKKDSNQLSLFLQKIATRFESRIIDSDSRQSSMLDAKSGQVALYLGVKALQSVDSNTMQIQFTFCLLAASCVICNVPLPLRGVLSSLPQKSK